MMVAEILATGLSSAAAALWGAGIGAFVSVVALIVNYRLQRSNEVRERLRVQLEFHVRQLNELYGPLRFLIEQNRRLAIKLRDGKEDPNKWRLLDNVESVLNDPRDLALAKEILEIDGRIEGLIIDKAGLIHGPPPQSFDRFLAHYSLLALAMSGAPIGHVGSLDYFPREINDDVMGTYKLLANQVSDLLQEKASQGASFVYPI
jgi:hypothetical protein